jgi:hypothetical protein
LQFALINSRLNAESPDTQVTLAWILYQLGKGREAEAALVKASQLGTPSQDSNYLVGKIFAEQNRPEQAKQVLKMAMEMNAPGIFIYRKEADALLKSLK